jgi:hypothetical protein
MKETAMKTKAWSVGTLSLALFLAASVSAADQVGPSVALGPPTFSGSTNELNWPQEFHDRGVALDTYHPKIEKRQGTDFEAAHSFGSGFDGPFGENRVYGRGLFSHSFGGQSLDRANGDRKH